MLVPGVVLLQGQGFGFPVVEVHEVPVSPFLQPDEVPLDGSTTLCYASHPSQSGVICKLAELTLCPIIIKEDVKRGWSQHRPVGYSTSDWPPAGLCAADHHPWARPFSQVSATALLIHPHQQLLLEVLWESVPKAFQKSRWTVPSALPPFTKPATAEVYQVDHTWLALSEAMLTSHL